MFLNKIQREVEIKMNEVKVKKEKDLETSKQIVQS
jgi:hypothetical protein